MYHNIRSVFLGGRNHVQWPKRIELFDGNPIDNLIIKIPP